MMELSNLEHTDFDTLFHGFERAFSDYEIRFEKDEVRSMLERRGYDPRLSFAAFDNGDIVGRMKTDFVKVLNICSDDVALKAFLESSNIALASRQYEMILKLT